MSALGAKIWRSGRRRLLALGAGLLLLAGAGTVVVVLVTGSSDDEPAPLTQEQAELLAQVRFSNYRAETGAFEASVPVDSSTVELRGAVDWREHVGTAAVRTSGSPDEGANGLLQWSLSTVAFRPGEVDDPPAKLPRGGWNHRRLEPGASPVDTALALLLNLAIDRPENPQLLRQNGAEKLGEEIVDGAPLQIFSGPRQSSSADGESDAGEGEDESRLRYWVDEDGRLRRFEARLEDGEEPTTIDFDLDADQDVEVTPDLPVPEDEGGSRPN